jgi:hypothetical protein
MARPSTIGPLCIDKETGAVIDAMKSTYCTDETHLHLPNPEWWIAENGVEFKVGDRVYNYYDCEWVTVISEPEPEGMGWFSVKNDNGRRYTLNSVRISTRKP